MLKRLFDFVFSLAGLIVLAPLLLIIAVIIKVSSKGPVFFRQQRIGKGESVFSLVKFRSMYHTSGEESKQLTIGDRDNRITAVGYYLRKYKLDELPQLFNVLLGDMSIVGPRPEVKKYVNLYSPTQKQVFSVKPGITDYASIAYAEESELLAKSGDPEGLYVNEIMPKKLEMNLQYIKSQSLWVDVKIILKTLLRIIF